MIVYIADTDAVFSRRRSRRRRSSIRRHNKNIIVVDGKEVDVESVDREEAKAIEVNVVVALGEVDIVVVGIERVNVI